MRPCGDGKESLEKTVFKAYIDYENEHGLHVRASGTLVAIAKKHDCEYTSTGQNGILYFKLPG